MGRHCPLALCRPGPPIPHHRSPRYSLLPQFPYPKVDTLQKTLRPKLALTLPPDSLTLLLSPSTIRPRTTPWRLYYMDAGWVHPSPLVPPREVSGVYVCVCVCVNGIMCEVSVCDGCVIVCMLFGVRARCGLPPATPSYASWELHLQLWLRSLA